MGPARAAPAKAAMAAKMENCMVAVRWIVVLMEDEIKLVVIVVVVVCVFV